MKNTIMAICFSITSGCLWAADVSSSDNKTTFCKDESVSVSYTGTAPTAPAAGNGTGTWSATGNPTYVWSGDASGSSSSSTLPTSSDGSKTASVVVTQTWTCSDGGGTEDTTADGSGSFTVLDTGAAYTGGNPCTPPAMNETPNHSHPNLPSSANTRSYYAGSFPFRVRYVELTRAGTLSSVRHSIVPVKEGVIAKSGSCGTQIGTRTFNPSSWSISVGFSYRGISFSGAWTGSSISHTVFDGDNAQSESNVWKFDQAYKTNWRLDSAKLTAQVETTNTNTHIVTVDVITNQPVTLSSGLELSQYNYEVCDMCCSD